VPRAYELLNPALNVTNDKQVTSGRRNIHIVVLGGLVVIALATGPKVSGFKPGRSRWIFKSEKIQQLDFLRKRNKAVGPMS
jgi:hypothetical protein